MIMRTTTLTSSMACVALLALAVPGCGGESSSTDPDGGSIPQTTGPYLPWQEGNRWTYQITDNGKVSSKVVTVGAAEPVGGTGPNAAVMANKVVTVTLPDAQSLTWQAPVGTLMVRYREQSLVVDTGAVGEETHWMPHRVYLDQSAAHVKRGAAWVVSHEEIRVKTDKPPVTTTEQETWTVIADDDPVTVPAGAFRALVVQKTGGGNAKTYWFARGIGKVKELGGQLEELVSYQLK